MFAWGFIGVHKESEEAKIRREIKDSSANIILNMFQVMYL